MLLSKLLTPERIRVPIQAQDKPGVLRELVGLIADANDGEFGEIVNAVEDREAVLSTGIGHGVAIPHGKCPGLEQLRLAAGTSPEPIGFDALDGQPVRLFFLLVGSETSAADQVKALSRISRLARQPTFRAELLNARSAEEFYQLLCHAERT